MNRELNPSLWLTAGPRARIFGHHTRLALAISLGLILAAIPASATLGESEASVTSDQQHIKSEHRAQEFQNYKVHELTTNGTPVREFVSPQGPVFGLTRQALSTPDM